MSHGERIAAVQQIIVEGGLDAILVTNPANRRYLTGFSAEDHAADESSGVVVVTPDRAMLLVSPTNLPWAVAETDTEHVAVEPIDGSLAASVASRVAADVAAHFAVEDATTTAALWFELQDLLGQDVTLVRLGDAVDRLRAVKSPEELDYLREAARLTDEAFQMAVTRFEPGMSERAAADLVREALRDVGSDGEGFETIVASGPNAAKPHHRPGARLLQEGEPIIIDMGARVNGYNGDLTRTVCLGPADERLVRMYEVVLEAQLAGLSAIRAGVPASEPDLATREVFASHGLEQYVIHSAGHGLGLRVHEAPSMRRSTDDTLESGNVVTMEPGLYIDGWGGVRIEDVAVVRETDPENITSAPKGVESMQL
ncbi:MAG TPA: Xaa-Pro peptidase family protein [Thermomicrobiales bacterium]|nr:Xaa-Pro peptidase family protein [Thermomicrobiales bacterium]